VSEAKQPWFLEIIDVVVLLLVVVNVLLFVEVYLRRLRQKVRTRRTKRFRARCEQMLAELDPATRTHDPAWLHRQLASFDELERPIAATMLIERLRPVSDEERSHMLAALRDADALGLLASRASSRMPWRRALALRTLGWLGATEAVPMLLERLSDSSLHVRGAAVRALGRVGDPRALEPLGELFRAPGRVESGLVYDALVAFGRAAQPVFAGALRSPVESVRVAACFGVAEVSEPDEARPLLEPLLADASGPVRAAAARALGHVGGPAVPEGLARATRDELAIVRAAAVEALAGFDDPRAVELAHNALLDADRDTAVRAGETLVQLGADGSAWPVERARVLASLGAL
jgi:HEAT repeat protein